MTALTGFGSTTSTKLALDGGTLYVGATKWGAMRGGATFDPGIEWTEIGYDGQRAVTAGLERKTFARPKITGTVIEFDQTRIEYLEPNATYATSGTPSTDEVQTITPDSMGALLAQADYLTNVRVVFESSAGKYMAVLFPMARVVKYTLTGQDKNAAEFAIEIEARHDPDDATSVAPYKLEILRDVLPAA